MNKSLIAIPVIALLAFGAVFLLNQQESSSFLSNSSNTTTFTQLRTCIQNTKLIICDQIQDDAEKSLCYAASYAVSRLTFPDGDLITDACKNFHSYEATATANQMINYKNYYFSCYLSADVLREAYKCDSFYNKIYTPQFITCAGY
ncbi:hypothetical protein ABPG74_015407 [Tetrahymena malaccensis]